MQTAEQLYEEFRKQAKKVAYFKGSVTIAKRRIESLARMRHPPKPETEERYIAMLEYERGELLKSMKLMYELLYSKFSDKAEGNNTSL